MHPVFVVGTLVVIFFVGIYIGISGLATQYAVNLSGSYAGSLACAPQTTSIVLGQRALFSAAGLPAGTIYHWATDTGSSQTLTDGRFSVLYSSRGVKEVSMFASLANRWQRIPCQVTVR